MKRVRRLTRSNSALNLTEQLGVRGRPRLRRNNPIGERVASRPRGRSASRNRINLMRTNSKQNLRRRSTSHHRQGGASIRLNRFNSRLNLRDKGQQQQQQQLPNMVNAKHRSRSQSRSNVRRNTSVNARLGVPRQNDVGQRPRQRPGQRQTNKRGLRTVQRGRINKRQNTNRRTQANGIQQQQRQQQRSRSRSRFFLQTLVLNI